MRRPWTPTRPALLSASVSGPASAVMAALAIMAVMALLARAWRPGSAAAAVQSLPGARSVIDASRFPTLQAALDAVPEGGALVRLPAGVFEIDRPLVLKAQDVCVEGAGTATHIKNVTTDGGSALILEHPDGATSRETERWRVRLRNFRITGNEKSGHGIEARRINEILIDGVTSSYHGGDGVRLYYCYEDPRVCDSLFTYNKGTGLNLIGCHDIVVSSNQFEENKDALRCTDGFNLCMSGNNLDDHLRDGVVIENTYGSVVSGNMIEECRGTAIVLDRDCYGITLGANVIAHNGAGIDLRDAHGCAVSANTFTIVKKDALRIGPESGRIAVTGNSFSSSYIGGGKDKRGPDDRQAAGVVLAGTSDVCLSGNVFSGVRPKALGLEGGASRRVLFTGNLLVDAESDHEKLKASVVGGNLEGSKPESAPSNARQKRQE